MRHSHLGQQGRGGGKNSGEQRPSNPTHRDYGTRLSHADRHVTLIPMEPGRASKTALRVAIRRAAHQLMDHPPVLDDPIVLPLLGSGFARDMERAMHKVARDFRAFMAARSRYVEDRLAEAVSKGVSQYVVLGAGLDTFAYRNPFPSLNVFEVDFPATQQWKRELLDKGGIALPQSLTFVPLDFEHKALADGLADADFDHRKAAFFSWLGVVPFLTLDAFRATLGAIAHLPGQTVVSFDYAFPPRMLSPQRQKVFNGLSQRMAAAGEPFQLFFTPEALESELSRAGFRRTVLIGYEQLNDLYFEGRADGLRLSSSVLGKLATAWV
jgi:methyltransferase (TIGR00027 family)